MRKNVAKPLLASVIAAMCVFLGGCASHTREYTVIDGEKIEFASEYESEKWRAPLEKLLSNTVGMEFYDDVKGELVKKDPPYLERPSVEKGYGCALYDLNSDGTPELLVNMGGGSAGNAPYEVYDIFTGENIGAIESSPGDSICCYYDSEERNVTVVSQFYWRSGWSSKMFFTSFITPDEGGFCEELYLMSSYYMEHDNIGEDDFFIVCREMSCYVWGERAEPEWYLSECEYFNKRYIRIKETGLEYVSWYEIEEDDDTHDELGKKMAESLLSSGQKFIVYGEE